MSPQKNESHPPLPNDATLAERLVACYVVLERLAKVYAYKDAPSFLSKVGMTAAQIGYGRPVDRPGNSSLSPLDDGSPMPFGKYKGQAMDSVPASYFFWLWTSSEDPMSKKTGINPVADYIKKNLETLKREYPDGVWE